MPHRVSPTDRIRGHIDELFAQHKTLPEILEEVARLGAQLLMQAALEAEITEFLGRDRYQRAAACEDARPGSRNGYREVTVKSTAGPVMLARPKLRGTTEAFASRLFGSHVTKTNALETLVIASFVRGLSVRDVEAALAEALGDQAAISKSTVSVVCGQIKDEYEAWARRRLDGITLDYLFLDASFFRMHPGSPAEPVLAAWGITTGGKPAFLGLAPGAGESADAWHDFLQDLKDRGLPSPLLVISDGAPGLIAAIEQAFPQGAASALLDPSREKRPGQGPGRDASRGQGRLLGPVRHRRPEDPARPPARRARRSPDHRDGRPVRGDLPGGDEMPARRPRRAHRLPAVPR
jgi:transposase-like protein